VKYKQQWSSILDTELSQIDSGQISFEELKKLVEKEGSVIWTQGSISVLTKMMMAQGWESVKDKGEKKYLRVPGSLTKEGGKTEKIKRAPRKIALPSLLDWEEKLSQTFSSREFVPAEEVCTLLSEDPDFWNSGTRALLTKVMSQLGWVSKLKKKARIYYRKHSEPSEGGESPERESIPVLAETKKKAPFLGGVTESEIDSYISQKGFVFLVPKKEWKKVLSEWLDTLKIGTKFEVSLVLRLLASGEPYEWSRGDSTNIGRILLELGCKTYRKSSGKSILRIYLKGAEDQKRAVLSPERGSLEETPIGEVPLEGVLRESQETPSEELLSPVSQKREKIKRVLEKKPKVEKMPKVEAFLSSKEKPFWYVDLIKNLEDPLWEKISSLLEERKERVLEIKSLKDHIQELDSEMALLGEALKKTQMPEGQAGRIGELEDQLRVREEELERKTEELSSLSKALRDAHREIEVDRKSIKEEWEKVYKERERLTLFGVKQEEKLSKAEKSLGESSERIKELEAKVRLLEEAKKNGKVFSDVVKVPAQGDSEALLILEALREERDRYQKEVLDIQLQIEEAQKSGKIVVYRKAPRSIRDLFESFGISLHSRLLAKGSSDMTSEREIFIKLEGDQIHRDVYFHGTSPRRYQSLSLNEDPRKLIDIFFPCKMFYRENTDLGVVEVMKLLGKPLSFPTVGNRFSRTTEF